jgi:NTE family protein
MDDSRNHAAENGSAQAAASVGQKIINLALQGGGAHGAFTWGVLDRIAEDERIMVDGITATSAGAMNAVVFTYGWAEGGRNGARRALTNFWRRISHAALASPLQPSWFDRVAGNHSLQFSPAFVVFDLMAGFSARTSSIPSTRTRCATCCSRASISRRSRRRRSAR